jgi:hypothetical protein
MFRFATGILQLPFLLFYLRSTYAQRLLNHLHSLIAPSILTKAIALQRSRQINSDHTARGCYQAIALSIIKP